jgi:hypothetical protein
MRLYNLEDSAQHSLQDSGKGNKSQVDDKPAFDKTSFGGGMKSEKGNKAKYDDILF